jgi:hypothetical protein
VWLGASEGVEGVLKRVSSHALPSHTFRPKRAQKKLTDLFYCFLAGHSDDSFPLREVMTTGLLCTLGAEALRVAVPQSLVVGGSSSGRGALARALSGDSARVTAGVLREKQSNGLGHTLCLPLTG